ncbi:hypothetical protein EIP91_001856 [Steccherinum ochraceum]|uniref:Uncharacterized protein n=1 Tax=Steccherinum ochraceum TaxID=92696 RepID=A0A4R0RQF9_9APHY|nr:hypothetical protein EIP91_001856 [Steccherinum ochraceum]
MRPIAAFFLAALFATTALAAPVDDPAGSQDQVSENSHLYRRLTDVGNAVYARGVNDGMQARDYDEHQHVRRERNRLAARASLPHGQARPYTAPPTAPEGEHKSGPPGPRMKVAYSDDLPLHDPQPIRPTDTHSAVKNPDQLERDYKDAKLAVSPYQPNGR